MPLTFVSSLAVAPTTRFYSAPSSLCPHHRPSALPSKRQRSAAAVKMTLDVLVTGASGRTGSLVFNLLAKETPGVSVKGLVRDKVKAVENPLLAGCDDQLVEGDITVPETLVSAIQDVSALVILTSAIPRMEPQEQPSQGGPPSMYYDAGGAPEEIDWVGARTQIDLAKSIGLSHVVLVGSMGSTEEDNMLNKIANGNILKFKRKAELYLIDSGVPYTVINPGGLVNDPPKQRQFVIGNNDELFSKYDRRQHPIPRGDVARIVVSALLTPAAKNKAMDVITLPVGEGTVTEDPAVLFENAYATI